MPEAGGKHDSEQTQDAPGDTAHVTTAAGPEPFLKVERSGPRVHIRLNRPDKANRLELSFWTELPALIRAYARDPQVRVMVISGEGKHLSAGMDLAAFAFIAQAAKAEPGRAAYGMRQEILRLQDACNAMEEARFPIIAVASGACIGAAVDLLCAADLRIASADARFAIEEVKVGIAADLGTLQRLPKLIAPAIAKELAFTGRPFSAQEAFGWGFVNSVHADKDAAIAAALALADEIAAKTPLAVAGIKRAIDYVRDHPVAEGLDQIATWNAGMLSHDDFDRAMHARMTGAQAQFIDMPRMNESGWPDLPSSPDRQGGSLKNDQ